MHLSMYDHLIDVSCIHQQQRKQNVYASVRSLHVYIYIPVEVNVWCYIHTLLVYDIFKPTSPGGNLRILQAYLLHGTRDVVEG